jgi:hypothetical protein
MAEIFELGKLNGFCLLSTHETAENRMNEKWAANNNSKAYQMKHTNFIYIIKAFTR